MDGITFNRVYRLGFIRVFACDEFCEITLFKFIHIYIDSL